MTENIDPSITGFTALEFAEMDDEEKAEALEDLENRAKDIMFQLAKLTTPNATKEN